MIKSNNTNNINFIQYTKIEPDSNILKIEYEKIREKYNVLLLKTFHRSFHSFIRHQKLWCRFFVIENSLLLSYKSIEK